MTERLDQVALAAEVERLRAAVAELSVLNEAAAALGRADDLGAAVEALVRRALRATGAEEGVIVLVPPHLREGDDAPPTFIRSVVTRPDREVLHPSVSLLGWVQAHQRPLVLNDPRGDARFRGAAWPDHVRSVLAVPMFVGRRLTGVLTLYNKTTPPEPGTAGSAEASGPVAAGTEAGFTESDARLLGILASQSAQAVERMRLAGERERALRLFGQHTAPQVVEALMAHGGEVAPRRQDVTVLFLDLRGFTALSEAWPPEDVVAYLNAFFGEAIALVVAHGGVVHQLLGDGLMALFGVPVPDPAAPRQAVAAARAILEAVDRACAEGRLAETRLGIGIHAGEAVVGLVGTADHREYKVTGDVVNVAARIEKLNKAFDARLLVSGPVARRLGEEGGGGEALGEVALPGRSAPVELVKLA